MSNEATVSIEIHNYYMQEQTYQLVIPIYMVLELSIYWLFSQSTAVAVCYQETQIQESASDSI